MNRAQAEAKLAALGFEIDWSCTGKSEGYWSGTIDTIGRMSICGDCFGPVINGETAADFYRNAVAEAEGHAGTLTPCTNPDCDLHADFPINEAKT
jgi:hypothetical protein